MQRKVNYFWTILYFNCGKSGSGGNNQRKSYKEKYPKIPSEKNDMFKESL